MPFEKFKEITDSKDQLQLIMYNLFREVYTARTGKFITLDDMKRKFVQNVGYIKSNYASLDLDAKLPRHNYVISVLNFLELLKNIEDLDARDGDEHLPFLKKICTTLLKQMPRKQKKKIGETITVQPKVIKQLGEMFYSEKFDIKSDIWQKSFKWGRNDVTPTSQKSRSVFNAWLSSSYLLTLLLLMDWLTTRTGFMKD